MTLPGASLECFKATSEALGFEVHCGLDHELKVDEMHLTHSSITMKSHI